MVREAVFGNNDGVIRLLTFLGDMWNYIGAVSILDDLGASCGYVGAYVGPSWAIFGVIGAMA